MAQDTKNLSDFWRHDRCYERTGELISILRGAATLVGNMGSDMKVEWSRNGESYTDFKNKKVALDFGPLVGESPMFRGSKVDEIIGYAAHEGGHCKYTAPGKYETIARGIRPNYNRMPESFRQAVRDDNEAVIRELCRLQNILEDAYIDTKVASEWPVLGEYIRISRNKLEERTPVDLNAIVNNPDPDRNAVVNLWCYVALFGHTLPRAGDPRVRKAVQSLMRITRNAMKENIGVRRQGMVFAVARVLWKEFPVKFAPLPQLPPPPDQPKADSGGGSGDSTPSEDQSDDQSTDSTDDGASGGPESKDEDEAGGSDGDTEADTDDDAQPEDSKSDDEGTGASGDDDQDTDEDKTEAARGDITRVLQQILDAVQADADGDKADSSSGASDLGGAGGGEIGNLDDYDAEDGISDGGREVIPVPDAIIEAIKDAMDSELQDISDIVAATLEVDPRNLIAQARKATYDPYQDQAISNLVKDEVEEIERAFKRQQDVNSRMLRGRDKGKLDDRRLYKPFVGDKNFRKQRVVLAQPDRDVGLLLDVSQSMGPHFEVVKATAAIFAGGLRKVHGINFAAWTYTGDAAELQLTRITDLHMGGKLHLGNIIRNGMTPSGLAIAGAKAFLDTMPARNKLLIHFTDGQPQGVGHVLTAVKKCREAGIEVYVIGMAGMEDSLRQQYGEGNYETIHEVPDLPAAVTRIVRKLGAPQV